MAQLITSWSHPPVFLLALLMLIVRTFGDIDSSRSNRCINGYFSLEGDYCNCYPGWTGEKCDLGIVVCKGTATDTFGNDDRRRADGPSNSDPVTATVIILDTEVDSENVYKIGCCAQVDAWRIRTWSLNTVYLQIWRPTGAKDEFQLVGEHAYVPTTTANVWQTVTPTTTIIVQTGDVMGWKGNSLRTEVSTCCDDLEYALYSYLEDGVPNTIGTTQVFNTRAVPGPDPDRKNYLIEMTVKARPAPDCSITLASANIPETGTTGVTIGRVSTSDTLGSYTYSVTSPVGYFSVDASGNIITTANLTTSSPPASENYAITIEIRSLCNETAACTATQVVTDVNHPISITSLPDTAYVRDCTTSAQIIHTVITYDMDRNDATDNPLCSLVSPVGGAFEVVPDGGNPLLHYVKTKANPGFTVATPQHIVKVGCTDSVDPTTTSTGTLTVSITDRSDETEERTTTKCGIDDKIPNPCTDEEIKSGNFHHPHPFDKHKYIQCDEHGGSWVKECASPLVWNQDIDSCDWEKQTDLGDETEERTTTKSVTDEFSSNPCTEEETRAGNFYHPHPLDKHKYIQCDEHGGSWVKDCPHPLVWNQVAKTCSWEK